LQNCVICQTAATKLFEVKSQRITSISRIFSDGSETFYCENCSHVQTHIEENERDYYENNYPISLKHEDDDQVYDVIDGHVLYRNQHQFNILMERTHLDSSKKILDFGAAKGTIAKKLVDELGSENVYVYEVSDSYVNYWNPKILTENQAINIIPREWEKSFDLLISIFVMEHVSEIRKYIRQAVDFLTTEGQIFAIVPYLLTNPCDLLVSDHPNHFTKQSLMELLQSAGFSEILIADDLFRGALIVTAKLKENQMEQSKSLEENFRVLQLAEYWNIQSKILENYEIAGEGKVAIYGGGIYGLFIYSKLEHKTKIACFIDQNPFLQGERHEGIEIVSPENIPAGVDTIFVGLNPRIAVQAISNTKFNVDKSKIKIVYLSEF
jgi:2-polyprenyl-3-methyl-5-hydroxy-6-metoxy-1,4-benzoquinol methylase